MLPAQPWRERREAYQRERGRLADLIRGGYAGKGLAGIQGGGCRVLSDHRTLADCSQRTAQLAIREACRQGGIVQDNGQYRLPW